MMTIRSVNLMEFLHTRLSMPISFAINFLSPGIPSINEIWYLQRSYLGQSFRLVPSQKVP